MKKNKKGIEVSVVARSLFIMVLFLLIVPMIYAQSQFMDYFKPMPIVGSLTTNCWGSGVGPRDQSNGLEDRNNRYCYWDGGIIKGSDGVYHMFGSRWNESAGHNGWFGSVAVHATSNNLYGPYTDQGLVYSWDENGKGHNVLPMVLKDGRYAVYVSETRRPGIVYVSENLNGPWSKLGTISIASNSYSSGFTHSNVFIMLRPDGRYGIISRDGLVGVGDNVLGPYTIQGPNVYAATAGMQTVNVEDPCMWYSGGFYHLVANKWDTRKAYHMYSENGLTNWKLDSGFVYDPTTNFLRYTDGTVNRWNKLERFNVYIEDGHVKAILLAAIDVAKDAEQGNDSHGSKVIVVPFDGEAFDSVLSPTPTTVPTPTPTPNVEAIFTGGPYPLDGVSSYIDLPDGITNELGDFTIACRVTIDTLVEWTRVFDFGGSSDIFMMFTPASGTTGNPYFAITLTGNTGEQGIEGSAPWVVGSPQHLAIIKQENTGVMYINGQEVGRNEALSLSPSELGNTVNNFLGRSQWSHDPYLAGTIEDFKIFNRGITSAELDSLVHGEAQGTLGDVNTDDVVNIVDALLVAQFYVGLPISGVFVEEMADVNCDGVVNIVDALLIAQYYVSLIDKFCE
ncbi:MAG: hypothetical protein JXR70_07015 [Spirochaetales bacterium]|nr:hypothetical protein [Spirochaetales bacterium]